MCMQPSEDFLVKFRRKLIALCRNESTQLNDERGRLARVRTQRLELRLDGCEPQSIGRRLRGARKIFAL